MPAVKFTERPVWRNKGKVFRCDDCFGNYLGDVVSGRAFFPGARIITLPELVEIMKFMVKSQRNEGAKQ